MATELAKVAFDQFMRDGGLSADAEIVWGTYPACHEHWQNIANAVLEPVLKKLGIDIPSIDYLEDLPEGEFVVKTK